MGITAPRSEPASTSGLRPSIRSRAEPPVGVPRCSLCAEPRPGIEIADVRPAPASVAELLLREGRGVSD